MPQDFCPGKAGFTYEQAVAQAAQNGEDVVPAFCGMCSPAHKCRIYAFKKNGRMTHVMGMSECRENQGAMCSRGLAAPQWLHSSDRLTTPLLRIGERGEGKFKPISWDEAVQIIAKTLLEQKEKYGPETLAILSPNQRTYKDMILRFLAVHGSPNHAHSGICALQRGFAQMYTLGARAMSDNANADLIIYWARQPVYAGPASKTSRDLVSAKKRRATIVAIKPSLEPDSTMADFWLPLRPGTDAALALAMLHVVIGEDLIDHDFVAQWCEGFAPLREHVKQYTPEWAEHITGVDAELICNTARLYATTKKATIDLGNGVEHAPSSNDATRAISILMAITGHLDRPGCNFFAEKPAVPQPKSVRRPDLYTNELISKLPAPEFPLPFQPFIEGPSTAYYKTIESVLTGKPFKVRTIIAPGTQPVVSNRGSRNVIEALKQVDFFVVIDVMKTAEMAYADLVIPTATPYECDHPFGLHGNTLIPHNRVIEPLGEYKSTIAFFMDLATAMGYGDDFWQGDIDAYENYRLEPYGITIDELRKHPMGIQISDEGKKPREFEKYAKVFASKSTRLSRAPYLPNGKVALYNTTFEAAGYNPLPVWREPPESPTGTPELLEQYPLMLSDYHTSKNYNASWMRNVPALRQIAPEPSIHIHPSTAKARGIADGDWVKVESPHGWLKVKAEYYEGIRPDVVMMVHGWWQGCQELGYNDLPLLDGGANVNLLYSVADSAYDPLVTAMSSQTLVEVTKI